MTGEGSIYQRADRKWVAQLSFGTREHRSYRRRIRDTRAAALVALTELRVAEDAWANPSSRNLGDYLRWWLAETVGKNLTPNTIRGYNAAIDHFAPIAHIPLRDLRAEHIEATCNRMRATRYMGPRRAPVDIGPASPKTVRNAQLMLRTALEVAYQRGHVRRNEAKLVRLAPVARERRSAMTPDLARGILRAIEGDRFEAAYALALAGFREGEILGLAREDVDLDAGVVNLWRQLRGSGRTAVHAKLKTKTSEGKVDLPEFALSRLRAHVALRDPVALLFTTEAGWAVNGSWFTKHFQRLLSDAGLPRLRLHDLRAGASTLLALRNAHPAVARDFLRHANVTTTLTYYTRTTPEQRRDAARMLDEAVSHEVSHDEPTIGDAER